MDSIQPPDERIVRSHCRICHGGCGVLVHVKDGRVIRIEGDPESPISRGPFALKELLRFNWLIIRIDCSIL